MQRRFFRLAWAAALWWIISLQPFYACTLWGAAGNSVEGGGILITKNRDWIPDHCCAIDPPDLQRKPGASSTKRSARIEELLKNPGSPYTVDDFIRFSEDKTAGADNSIWRTGSAPHKTRTLATWVVSIPASGSPRLYLKTANPGEAERLCRLTVTMPSGSPTGIRFRWTAISAKDRHSI